MRWLVCRADVRMMALVDTSPGSWFSNWQPPTDFLPDVQSNAAVGGNTEVAHFPIQNKPDADYGHRGRGEFKKIIF